MPLTAAQVLANFASELGVSDDRVHKIPYEDQDGTLLAWDDEDDCDYSSFPSLSLEESPGNYHAGVFHNRSDVESHVESLLARPILLGKQPDDDSPSEDDSLDEFFANSVQEIPKLMLGNFCTSFNTLMNSRLRAYANFLARHVQSHARCSKTDDDIEGVACIERKLETMLGIGQQVSAAAIASEFSVDQGKFSESFESEDTEGEDSTFQASMPLKMNISIDIALPHIELEDCDETLKVTFEAHGKICGIFSKPSLDGQQPLLLRVAEVSIGMHELLSGMTEQASLVISCIVEMTNKAYVVPLPDGSFQAAADAALPQKLDESAYNSQSLKKRSIYDSEDEDVAGEDDDEMELSPEKCANIIDCVIGEIDDDVISPPHQKKLKVLPDGLCS